MFSCFCFSDCVTPCIRVASCILAPVRPLFCPRIGASWLRSNPIDQHRYASASHFGHLQVRIEPTDRDFTPIAGPSWKWMGSCSTLARKKEFREEEMICRLIWGYMSMHATQCENGDTVQWLWLQHEINRKQISPLQECLRSIDDLNNEYDIFTVWCRKFSLGFPLVGVMKRKNYIPSHTSCAVVVNNMKRDHSWRARHHIPSPLTLRPPRQQLCHPAIPQLWEDFPEIHVGAQLVDFQMFCIYFCFLHMWFQVFPIQESVHIAMHLLPQFLYSCVRSAMRILTVVLFASDDFMHRKWFFSRNFNVGIVLKQ